jgi:hypothetical protein
LYFRKHINTLKDFEELRFDCYEFMQQADITKLKKYAKQYPSQKFQKKIQDFIYYVKQNA